MQVAFPEIGSQVAEHAPHHRVAAIAHEVELGVPVSTPGIGVFFSAAIAGKVNASNKQANIFLLFFRYISHPLLS